MTRNGSPLAPYESGFEAFEDAPMKFDLRYYLVANLVSCRVGDRLFPWAVVLLDIGIFRLVDDELSRDTHHQLHLPVEKTRAGMGIRR
jgi:NADH:ubiquinone oxidoreductase subunit 3 (subunit A)